MEMNSEFCRVESCAGALPQPGPIFQALPEPLPLPPLPQPERPAEAMTPSMAPESAPAGLPQPGTVLQVTLCTRYDMSAIRLTHMQLQAVWAHTKLRDKHIFSVPPKLLRFS